MVQKLEWLVRFRRACRERQGPNRLLSSGSLLRVVKRLGQMTELVGLDVGSCITHFGHNTELVETKNASELLLRNRLFREHDGGAMRTLLTLWRVEQYELLDLPQFIEQVFHR